jgi:hypothetical protein
MSEFVGRTGSNRVYSYPETRRSGDPLTAFARNFATGTKSSAAISGGGIQVPWNAIDVSPGTPSTDVPITPRSTGIVRISGVISVENSSGSPIAVAIVSVQINNGIALPFSSVVAPLADDEAITIPFLVEVSLPIGVTSNIEIFVSGDNAHLLADGSAIEVQEVSVATG